MLTKKETEYMNRHFQAFIRFLQEYFDISEEEALREVQTRIKVKLKNEIFILRAHLDISEKEALREIEARVKRKLKNL